MKSACVSLEPFCLLLVLAATLCGCGREPSEPEHEVIAVDVKLSVSFEKTEAFTDSLLTTSFLWETGNAYSAMDKSLWVSVLFRDKDGNLLWETSHLPETSTARWRASQLIRYNRTLYLPPTIEGGKAFVFVGLYDKERPDAHFVISGPAGPEDAPWLMPIGSLNIMSRPSMLDSPSRANVVFESGFYPVERDGKQEWRWTGREARAKLERLHDRGVLFLSGHVSIEKLKTLPVVTISLAGQERARFSPDADNGRFQRMLIVGDQEFGDSNWLDLSIEISETFVPSKSTESSDDRELGMRLMKIYFGPAGP